MNSRFKKFSKFVDERKWFVANFTILFVLCSENSVVGVSFKTKRNVTIADCPYSGLQLSEV
jgi:hypothetical protein